MQVEYNRASCGTKVMPANVVVRSANNDKSLCIGVINSGATAFAARMRNLNTVMQTERNRMTPIVLRDSRCRPLGPKGKEYVEELERTGGSFQYVGSDESAMLNAIYDTLIAIEEHDLSIGTHEVDKRQFVEYMRHHGTCRRTQLFRTAAHASQLFAHAVGTAITPSTSYGQRTETVVPPRSNSVNGPVATPFASVADGRHRTYGDLRPDVVIGDTDLDGVHLGIVGIIEHDGRRLAVSCAKPLCMVVLGYMGSGKSYSLGVLMENALLAIPNISRHRNPMAVIAFNFRRNPEARFEYWGFRHPNSKAAEVDRLRSEYDASPIGAENVNVFGYGPELLRRQGEYRGIPTFPILFRSEELGAEHWEILMKPPSPQTEYMDIIRDIIQRLFYQDRLTFKNLEKHIQTDERMTDVQRKRAMNRLSFAAKWISDERSYEWKDFLTSGSLNIFDLRMQTMTSSDALKLCLVVTDLVRRTRNGVNKLIVFDEAHEYVGSKELVSELENAITQIRHDGLSFILASQFPDRIPETIFKYLLTRMIFKLPNLKGINYIRKAAPNLDGLSPHKVSNLDLEQGVCFIQTDDDCTDTLLRVPQLLVVRPRCTQHGGETVRMADNAFEDFDDVVDDEEDLDELDDREDQDGKAEEQTFAEPKGAHRETENNRRPGQLFTNSLGITFSWIPPGTFLMGSPSGEEEREPSDEAQHRTALTKGFYMGIHPVTQAQWMAVMGRNVSHFRDEALPMEKVSWTECVEFCEKLRKRDGMLYRLPSEAEWEYACRAGTVTPFYLVRPQYLWVVLAVCAGHRLDFRRHGSGVQWLGS
jgi:Sulfatase-modifying factor enzyme 1